MSASKKLSNSVKALIYLDSNHPTPKRSNQIAEAIGCNASKIRQLLSLLVKNNIVESTQGSSGGFKLKRSLSELNLQDIYCTVEDQKAFPVDMTTCFPDSNNIDAFFVNLYDSIQQDIEQKMKQIPLNSITMEMK